MNSDFSQCQADGVLTLISKFPADTKRAGQIIGKACIGGEILLLHGDLGAGKTCLVQGLALGLGVSENVKVVSPTFTLHGEYSGRLRLNHVDLYRLNDAKQVAALGVDEMLAVVDAVLAVEWPETMQGMTAGNCLRIGIKHLSPESRLLHFWAEGESHRLLLKRAAADFADLAKACSNS